jgi:hypothetical protein
MSKEKGRPGREEECAHQLPSSQDQHRIKRKDDPYLGLAHGRSRSKGRDNEATEAMVVAGSPKVLPKDLPQARRMTFLTPAIHHPFNMKYITPKTAQDIDAYLMQGKGSFTLEQVRR